MLRTEEGIKTLLKGRNLQLVHCWEILPLSIGPFYFTEASTSLILSDGNTYIPVGGANASAVEKQFDLSGETNRDVEGVVTSNLITDDDLRRGRYDNSTIREHVVDYKYPWAGDIIVNEYKVSELSFSESKWNAKMLGLANLLVNANGHVISRTCPHQLGDNFCRFSLVRDPGTVSGITDPRSRFASTLTAPFENYYKYGDLEFTSGDNMGKKLDIKLSRQSNGIIELRLRTKSDIQNGDTFTVARGCSKLFDICRDQFVNTINNGSFPAIPGIDKGLDTPNLT